MKDKFMEIAKETFGVFTDAEFSSKLRGIANNGDVAAIIETSVNLINESPNADRIKRQCVRSEIRDNPLYENAIVEMVMSDQDLTDTVVGGFIARSVEKSEDGQIEFTHKFYLNDNEKVARISTNSEPKPSEYRRELREKYGFFEYDIPENA